MRDADERIDEVLLERPGCLDVVPVNSAAAPEKVCAVRQTIRQRYKTRKAVVNDAELEALVCDLGNFAAHQWTRPCKRSEPSQHLLGCGIRFTGTRMQTTRRAFVAALSTALCPL